MSKTEKPVMYICVKGGEETYLYTDKPWKVQAWFMDDIKGYPTKAEAISAFTEERYAERMGDAWREDSLT